MIAAARRLVLPVSALALLAACAAPPPGPEPALERPATVIPAERLESCNAGHLADALGMRLVQGAAGTDEVALSDLPERHRIVAPGMRATLDFVPDRLTVATDAAGIITRLTCG